ncbi:glycosyltransferase [Amorphus sp. 3PC139-8]|uniref:glycosyltransferase n=1 Tax=Amorphus sp. 3PC139-8 TaxID=2735676 RepID=UPI00345D0EA4
MAPIAVRKKAIEPSDILIFLPDLRGGGAERIGLILGEEFLRAGCSVEFVLMQARGELLGEAEEQFAVHSLDCTRAREVPLKFARYLRERRPDALLAAMWPLTGIASIATRIAGSSTRLVASEHNDFRLMPSIKGWERWGLKYFGRALYGRCDGIVAVSAGVADSLREVAGLPLERITVIHNPVRRFEPGELTDDDCRLLSGWLESEIRLIAIGSLKQQKGFDVLLRSLAELRERIDARLLILGEGPLRGELEALSRDLGVDRHVWLPGFRHNPSAFLQHADVFILSSNWEGFGNVLVEALAAGVSVVSTDCLSGPSEILEGGRYGTLVEVGDHASLARGIEASVFCPFNRDLLIERAASFSPERAAQKYLEMFEK